jgi:HEPN domain-containing protein
MKPLTLEWVEKAEADFQAAEWLLGSPAPVLDAITFHAQQCVEKYLKAGLQEAAIPIPKTHDLEKLLDLTSPLKGGLANRRPDLALLSRFAVEVRYPGIKVTRSEAEEAFRICRDLRSAVRRSLGLPS